MAGTPSPEEVHTAITSAIDTGLEGIHELPYGVALAWRDKKGQWGTVNAYYAYCHQCRRWLAFDDARGHFKCSGGYWNSELAQTERERWSEIKKIADLVGSGKHPYFSDLYDRRAVDPVPGYVFPPLLVGKRQILRGPSAAGIASKLEVMVDVPSELRSEACGPLKVLLYFHGHGGEKCHTGPASLPGCATVSISCPETISGSDRCFWFTTGPGGAWDRHQFDKLTVSHEMLAAVSDLMGHILSALELIAPPQGLQRDLLVMGVSMGGNAVLEFARAFPKRVHAAAVIAGYYNDREIYELAQETVQIPFLLMHSRGDRACPFWMIEKFYHARTHYSKNNWMSNGDATAHADTESWFSDGQQHGPTDRQRQDVIAWLLRRT
eukprot:TRINITY_DN53154_c0_g1_i1.p1 TRINITY_DN53154_c0_g1~~TRINITY_DN53154_c0_g1_i1.p1  ORF type:complete len:380 (-),score=18.06 TRINITY_DN53154_c0_g1_i1:250-1389(-)